MHIHFLQHVSFEAAGAIELWARARGHRVSRTCFFKEDYTLPDPDEVDIVAIMGGPMSVHDEDSVPWMREEKAFLHAAMQAGKYLLGICLGAQMLAELLGAVVYTQAEKEIGFFPVVFDAAALEHPLCAGFPSEATLFHWHGEAFRIPEGAVPIGGSAACATQGFIYGDRVLAWQCHPEMTEERIGEMMAHVGHMLQQPTKFVQTAEQILAEKHHLPEGNRLLSQMLDRWVTEENGA